MAKEGVIEFSGTVAELLPNAMFSQLDIDHEVLPLPAEDGKTGSAFWR